MNEQVQQPQPEDVKDPETLVKEPNQLPPEPAESVEENTGAQEPDDAKPASDDAVADDVTDAGVQDLSSSEPALPVEEPVQEKVEEVLVQAQPSTKDESEEAKYLNTVRVEGSEIQKRMLAAIETFVERMPIKTELVPRNAFLAQHEFLQHLLWLSEKEYEDFRQGWNVLLVYFSANYGQPTPRSPTPISEYNINRYLHAWERGEARCQAYMNFMTLLRATFKVETRKHDIKTIVLERVAPDVLSEKGLNNLKRFYGA